MTPTVHVVATGGTIASTADDDGATPTIGGEELVEALPPTGADVDLTVTQVANVPSFAIGPDVIVRVGTAIRERAGQGVDGVIVTHGTDTMAVSAYYLDVALDPDVPVVLTGAQRRPDEPSPDGPANLQTAVTASLHDDLAAAGGVYVAFNDELHAARDVVKAHSHKLEAFRSPGKGPVATVEPGGLRFHREPGSRSVHVPVLETDGTVDVVRSGVGVSGGQLRARLDAVDGIVLEGTGLGNVTPGLASAVDDALAAAVPVVLTSQCHAGGVAGVYGTSGGGKRLLERGVIAAGDLPAPKARVKLLLALESSRDPADVAAYFE